MWPSVSLYAREYINIALCQLNEYEKFSMSRGTDIDTLDKILISRYKFPLFFIVQFDSVSYNICRNQIWFYRTKMLFTIYEKVVSRYD